MKTRKFIKNTCIASVAFLNCFILTACNGGSGSSAPIIPPVNLNPPTVYYAQFESTNGHTYQLAGESNIVISTTFSQQAINFVLTDLTEESTPTESRSIHQHMTFKIEPINNFKESPIFAPWSLSPCNFEVPNNNVGYCNRSLLPNNVPPGSSYNLIPYTSSGESLPPLTVTYLQPQNAKVDLTGTWLYSGYQLRKTSSQDYNDDGPCYQVPITKTIQRETINNYMWYKAGERVYESGVIQNPMQFPYHFNEIGIDDDVVFYYMGNIIIKQQKFQKICQQWGDYQFTVTSYYTKESDELLFPTTPNVVR